MAFVLWTGTSAKAEDVAGDSILSCQEVCDTATYAPSDTVPSYHNIKGPVGVGLSAGATHVLDCVIKGTNIVKVHQAYTYSAYMTWRANPKDPDGNVYDRAYGYPTAEVGALFCDYSNIQLSHDDPATPYFSNPGYEVGAYVAFKRDLWRRGRTSIGYGFENGIGLCTHPYNPVNNIDNELTGSRLAVYFGCDAYVNHMVSPNWEVGMGLEYKHFSNGSLDRPNKGINSVSIAAKVKYYMDTPELNLPVRWQREPFDKYTYFDVNVSWGLKTLIDEWRYNYRNELSAGTPNENSKDYKLYSMWGASITPMWRYSLKWASGIGVEYNLLGFMKRTKELEQLRNIEGYTHCMSTVGLSLHHEAIYKQMSLHMSLGWYVYRQTGYSGEYEDKPYYETVGLRYYPRYFRPLYIGYNVKAHGFRAYCMEVKIGAMLFKHKYGK